MMKRLFRGLRQNVTRSAEEQEDREPFPLDLRTFVKGTDRSGLHLVPPYPKKKEGTISKVEAEKFELDIVAVHGLGGDLCGTWMKKAEKSPEDDVFWLSQLLPNDLPDSRVYTFGYNSQVAFSKSVATIDDYSRDLLELLLGELQGGSRRPLIFICHSLGGLVVKRAMVIAYENGRYSEILQKTKAIMFMGTPHRGSDIASLAGPLTDLINFSLRYSGGSALAGKFRRDLLHELSRDAETLDQLNSSFIQRAKEMMIISCVETRSPRGLNQPVVSKLSSKLQVADEIYITLDADHMTMCRFSSSKESNYKRVRNALIEVARKISKTLADGDTASIQSLNSLTHSERRYMSYFQKDFQPMQLKERAMETCSWLLDTAEYQRWQADEGPAVLWITGNAGCGKTTLASFVLDTLTQNASAEHTRLSRPVVLAFFCARDNEARNDGRSVVCGLLFSILTARKNIIRRVRSEYGSVKQETGQPLEYLWKIFMSALEIASGDYCYIVIDGLDECHDRSRTRLFACIVDMLNTRHGRTWARYGKVKLLFTSQPQTISEWQTFETISDALFHIKIEDRPEGITKDILSVIDYEVDNLVRQRRCETSFGTKLKSALFQRAQNSFLWLTLVLSHVNTTLMLDDQEPQLLLEQLPNSLKEAYIRYLPPPEPQNAAIIRRYVQILVASRRSLTLNEIRALTNMDARRHESMSAHQLVIFQKNLEMMFGPLICLRDLQVDFIHSTVKEFLLDLAHAQNDAKAMLYGTDITSAHLALADACLTYLLHPDLDSDFFGTIEPLVYIPADDFAPSDSFDIQDFALLVEESGPENVACSKLINSFPGFDYAAKNWAHHFALCEHVALDGLKQKATLLSNPANCQTSNWYRYMAHGSRSTVPKFDRLDEVLVASMYGFSGTLRVLLSCDNGHGSVPDKQRTLGLFWAAARGHSSTVQVFLERQTDPNFLEMGRSPLIAAIRGGHRDVVSKLLQVPSTDPNFKDNSFRTPLLHAIAFHQHEVLPMLLRHKDIAMDIADNSGSTPLLEAASTGCWQCLLLLNADARLNFTECDKAGRNALSLAACTDCLQAIDLIVKHVAPSDVQSTDRIGRNAISHAAERSFLPMVERLWALGVSISQVDANGRNAISWAVNRPLTIAQKDERNTVLQFLVEKCPQSADEKDVSGWAPLAWAMDGSGDLSSTRILVETGRINVNWQDQSGRSVLSWAAAQGLEDITRYLLQVPRVQKNLRSLQGRTPLSYAAGGGHLKILRLLLSSQGIDPYIKDDQGRLPIDWARLNQHEGVVKELLSLQST